MSRILFVVFLLGTLSSNSQQLRLGQWGGVIQYDSINVPLTFELLPSGEDVPEIIFMNGEERRVVKNAYFKEDSLIIPIDPFDVSLRASFTAMSMAGIYRKDYRNLSIPFKASFGAPRFTKFSPKSTAKVKDRWDMTFSPGTAFESKGVGVFQQLGDQVTGSVLTTTSDYRYFEGMVDGDSIKVSSFDGAHAFMIVGERKGPDFWQGKIIFDNNYTERWEAVFDPEASIPDPFEMVSVEPGTERPYFDLLGAGSGKGVIDPLIYEGKVLIIQLFGTWCPNSHDQTKYLVKWYNENKDKDIAILGSSYEANYSKEYGLERLEKYKEVNSIPYDLVLGGRLSKRGAATPFTFMDKIEAFPTLVILDKQGYVRYVHSYFNGPATGDLYQAFDVRFNEIIAELLAE